MLNHVLLLFFLYACKNHAMSLNSYYIIQYILERSLVIVRTRTKAVHYRTITSGCPSRNKKVNICVKN
ncbi:hypothetical protein DXA27_02655 [Bacteroides fragilis]|uniref:Uncharacterized protein n=2 Tax=Bacteroides fragilis TaxID=817 RepID=A0A413K538_BACFG|nr:hypothetical protein BFAG_03467 [Bacteroides fragilis 3_1_12]QCQ33845.1 hypothetical protein IB64_020575 [Bacteroides fragilis]RGY71157.1 hypothetical protein DXA27_02655 [Bacteroides fragilis]